MKRKRERYYAMRVKRKWTWRRNEDPRAHLRLKILITAGVLLLLFVLFCVIGNVLKAQMDEYKAERAGDGTADAYVTAAPDPDGP